MTSDENPILSDLAWRILLRLAEGNLTDQQLAELYPFAGKAMEELREHGFISQSRVFN